MVRSCLSHPCAGRLLLWLRPLWGTWTDLEFGSSLRWNCIVQDWVMVIRSLSGESNLLSGFVVTLLMG
jgi:hypothetical protein